MSVSATVALDDCRMRVRTVPKARKSSTEPNPWPDQPCMNESTSGCCLRSGTLFFISERPRKSRENPITSSLMLRSFSLFERLSTNPRAISGTAMMDMSALNPNTAMIQAVIVVPMFAPIITPIAWASDSRPALTKPTTITVVALEDWITAVIPNPVSTPLKGLEVIAPSRCRSPEPAAFCSPELIMFIPKRNIPKAPRSVRILSTIIKSRFRSKYALNWPSDSKLNGAERRI